jgi:predicted TIM-barrel fold metal-dependent hydrolase
MIDVHSHMLLPVWIKAVEAAGEPLPGATKVGPAPEWSEEKHLAVMDKYGIAASVLSWPRSTYFLKGQPARDLARAMNEELASIVARHPKRFGAFVVLPVDDLNATVEEMIYALDVLGLDGVSCSSNIAGVYLGDSRFDEWFAEMDRRAVTLFIHPAVPKAMDQVSAGLNAALLEFMFDSTRMAANMVLSGAKKRFSHIRMICTHAGGTVPYLASRLSILEPIFGAGPNRPVQTAEEVLEGLSSFYFDLTASTAAASLDTLRHLVPTSQLLTGYDFPLMPEMTIAPAIERFERYPNFSKEDRRMIMTANAGKLFPRLAVSN